MSFDKLPLAKRGALMGALVILGGVLFQIGYLRWWPAILVTPLPIALAFALCRSRWGAMVFGLCGGFVALRIHQDVLAAFGLFAANSYVFLTALTMIPVALAIHEGLRRGHRMVWVLPVAWVGAEALRLLGSLGLPFAVLGFACHGQERMIQVADLGGPMVLSFAIAAANGAVLDFLLARGSTGERVRHALLPGGVAVVVGWMGIFGYGQVRIKQVERAMEPGPRIAVLQSDAIQFEDAAKNYDGAMLFEDLKRMSVEAAATAKPPDLIMWPEKAGEMPIFNDAYLRAEFDPRMLPNDARAQVEADPTPFAARWERMRQVRAGKQAEFLRWVDDHGIPVLAGLTHQRMSGEDFPRYFAEFNAATLFEPGAGESEAPPASQYKMRLFPGGEFMPGGKDLWLRWTGWLPAARGWIESTGDLGTGEERVLMQVDGHPFVVSICSEIFRSDSAGVFADSPEGRQPLILTMANEGRFHRNRAVLVAKMAMAFRAVEARTTVARATNAAISGFADPVGRYYGFVTNDLGSHYTGLGAPDAVAIDAVVAFLQEQRMEAIAADPALLAEHRRKVAEVERLRSLAGIHGFSVRETHTTSLRTVYQQGGHHFPNAVLAAFALFLVITLLRPRGGRGKIMDER